jgi:GNAT superfamily N-acetyltransferase
MTTDLHIRLAAESDLEPLLALYESTRLWLVSLGSDQWSANTPDRMRDRFLTSIHDGHCYVAESDGRLVATVTVDNFADPEFWTDDDAPDDALYVHRMIVDRQTAGNDLGAALLDWAANLAAENGKRWLRLDAWRTNTKLHRYYERQGFSRTRIVSLPHRGSGALFQREAKPTGI